LLKSWTSFAFELGSLVAELLLAGIFWDLGVKTEVSGEIIQETYLETYTEDDELQADMWNLLVRGGAYGEDNKMMVTAASICIQEPSLQTPLAIQGEDSLEL